MNSWLGSPQATSLKTVVNALDLNSADINSVNQSIYSALTTISQNTKWSGGTIAPLAEPANLSDLLDDLFNGSRGVLAYQGTRVDNVYGWLSDTNNVMVSSIASTTKLLTTATNAVQNINQVVNYANFYWITDNFNNTAYIDRTQTTVLIDTDAGAVTLSPSSLEVLTGFDLNVDTSKTAGIPGCNMLVLNLPANSSSSSEPQPTLDNSTSYDISNIVDGDSTTWFEVERNFIAPSESLGQQGQAYVYQSGSKSQTVLGVTDNLDWKVIVSWPNFIDSGPDGNGVYKAEFTDLTGKAASSTDLTPYAARLVFTATFSTPTLMTSINLAPYTRFNEIINVDLLTITLVGGQIVTVAENVQLGSNQSTSQLEQQILNSTGTQVVGSVFSIPTNQQIQSVQFQLSSLPVPASPGSPTAPFGLAHAFQTELLDERTQRNYLFFSSVDKYTAWQRVAINSTPPTVSTTTTSALAGTIAAAGAPTLAALLAGSSLAKSASTTNINSQLQNISIGGTLLSTNTNSALSNLGNTLGGIASVIGIGTTVANIIANGFAVNHTATVAQTVNSWDVFAGYRAGVAIKNLVFNLAQYTNQSVLVSTRRSFNGPVSAVGLFVEQSIPSNWGAGQWITYYVSTDGTNWTQITPMSGNTLSQSYVPPAPIDSIYFKAVMNPNPSDPAHTPDLTAYSLMGAPQLPTSSSL